MRVARDPLFSASLLAGLALFVCTVWPLVYGGLHTMHDMGDWYVPMRHFYAQCLQSGDSPEWIPNVYCGYYLQGDGQVGMYHPYHWLLYRCLPLTLAVNLEMTLSFLVMMVGVFVLLRRWGLERGVAMFGGVVVAFGGYQFQHYEHMNALQILAHVPWLTVLIDIAFRSTCPRRAGFAALGVAALTTSELLIGYPQYFWFSNLWEGSYALLLIASPATRPTLARIVALAGCKGLGIVGGAVQLLPTNDLLSTSVRSTMSRDERAQWPWHPFEWTTLVAPNLFRAKSLATFQPGIVSVALVSWFVVRRGVRGLLRERTTRLLIVLGLLTAILALGRLGGLYELHLDTYLIGVFRMPYRYLSLTNLVVGLLAAIGLRDLLRAAELATKGELGPTRPFLFLLPLLGLMATCAVWWIDSRDRAFYVERHVGSYPLALVGVVALAIVAWLIHRIERGRAVRAGVVALVMIMVVDLGGYGCLWMYRGGAPSTLDEYRAAIPQPPETEGFRASAAVQNQLVFHDVSMPHGYMPVLPDAPLLWEIDEYGERDEALLRVAGVKWLQDEQRGNRWTQVSGHIDSLRSQRREWIEVPDPQPRARIVNRARVVAGDAAAAVAASRAVDVARVAVIEQPVELDTDAIVGSARVLVDRPGEIHVAVDVVGRQLLVVNERTRPGWTVRVDGEPAPIVRTYGSFLGCRVGPAASRVEFRFEPDSLVSGRRWSGAAGILLCLAAIGVGLWSPRRSTSAAHRSGEPELGGISPDR